MNDNEYIKKLKEEHDFSFDKTNIPKKLIPLLEEIENNKRKWKSLYMAVWGLSLNYLKPVHIDKGEGDKLLMWGLPASKLKGVFYTPNELNKYLTNYDPDIHISQIIKIFTLLENYMFEYYSLKLHSEKKDFTSFNVLKKYLRENDFADEKELFELEYIKETRNSYIHRRGLVNPPWLEAYKGTGRNKEISLDAPIPLEFYDLEEWTELMIKIIKKSLEKLQKAN